MPPALLEVNRLTKRFGGFMALHEVTIHVKAGERFGDSTGRLADV